MHTHFGMAATRKKRALSLAMTGTDLEDLMPSELSQRGTDSE